MASAMRATVLSKIFFIVCRLRFQIPCAPATTYHCSPQRLSPARYISGETEVRQPDIVSAVTGLLHSGRLLARSCPG
jgi:hypothetical protein